VSGDLERRYWRAVATLPDDRTWALAEIERCFAQGQVPETPDGPLKGRLITTTMGAILDPTFMGVTRLWMPWKGKTIDATAATGRNLFAPSWRPVERLLWRGYDDVRSEADGRFSTFAFTVWTGASETDPGVEVLKIDYEHDESPAFLIRRVLDEVVHVGGGVLLGQALMTWRGRRRRAAWFQLRP
jgi:hypothetical protein